MAGRTAVLLHRQYYDEAALTLLCYEAFLRPSEGMELRTACFTPPEIIVSPDWSLVLAASEFGSQSKTGVIDDSVLWDSQSLKWFARVFRILKRRPVSRFSRNFIEGGKGLGIHVVPYQLRHTGSTWDKLQNYKPLW